MSPKIYWSTSFGSAWSCKRRVDFETKSVVPKKPKTTQATGVNPQSINTDHLQSSKFLDNLPPRTNPDVDENGVLWRRGFELIRENLQRTRQTYSKQIEKERDTVIQTTMFRGRKFRPRYKFNSDRNHDFSDPDSDYETKNDINGSGVQSYSNNQQYCSEKNEYLRCTDGGISIKQLFIGHGAFRKMLQYNLSTIVYKQTDKDFQEDILIIGLDEHELDL